MFRYVLLIVLLLIFTVACASPASQPQSTTVQEIHEENESAHEEEHSDGNEEEHDHEEKHHDDHEAEHEDDGDHREHEAHEHGAAELMIAWSGTDTRTLHCDTRTASFTSSG